MEKTIAAVSTPAGEGGISVIRISGQEALQVAKRVFLPAKKEESLQDRRVCLGSLGAKKSVFDRVLAVYFKAPNSYTGEDMVEISCHGGMFITRKALNLILQNGAVPAGPGEFTKRAFLNGKMDLVQAESVSALIRADTERAYRTALHQMSGRLSERFSYLKGELKDMLALVEANIDFAEEDIELFRRDKLQRRINRLRQHTCRMAGSYAQGRLITQGLRVAIIGPPNVGKSSLFNALCEKERVIVDEHPGTTRDTIEETIAVQGQKITFIDTAGIRKSLDRIEAKGVNLAHRAARNADLTLVVFDGSARTSGRTLKLFRDIPAQNKIFILNKSDLKAKFALRGALKTSAKKLTGISRVKKSLLDSLFDGKSEGDTDVITMERQANSLQTAIGHLEQCLCLLQSGSNEELLSIELGGALKAIGKITGEVTDDDILNHIFDSFCIGK